MNPSIVDAQSSLGLFPGPLGARLHDCGIGRRLAWVALPPPWELAASLCFPLALLRPNWPGATSIVPDASGHRPKTWLRSLIPRALFHGVVSASVSTPAPTQGLNRAGRGVYRPLDRLRTAVSAASDRMILAGSTANDGRDVIEHAIKC
jgi:hypothetical protein